MTHWRRLMVAVRAGIKAWRQAPQAAEEIYISEQTGEGWNEWEFPNGFVDLYSIINRKDIFDAKDRIRTSTHPHAWRLRRAENQDHNH